MTPEIPFNLPPENLKPADGDIHVFCASLEQPPARLARLEEALSEDERHRAGRFHFKKGRDRFVAGRGMLREILGWLLKSKPGGLSFYYGSHGKPRLAAPVAGQLPYFNLAHCDSLAVYAVSSQHEVGVDVERIFPIRDMEDIMAHFFSEQERKQWRLLPANAKTEAFFNCWVSREALLKAHGNGIGEPLDQIEASSGGDVSGSGQFSMCSLQPALGFVAAVAARCREPRVNCWSWRGARSNHARVVNPVNAHC